VPADSTGRRPEPETGYGQQMDTAMTVILADGRDLAPQLDRDVLVGGYAEQMATVMHRALAGGFDGWVDDDLAFTADWGFQLDSVAAPVTVWQADLDLMVPQAHGRWLAAHVPTATARLAPGHGHISLMTRFRAEILDDLARSSGALLAGHAA